MKFIPSRFFKQTMLYKINSTKTKTRNKHKYRKFEVRSSNLNQPSYIYIQAVPNHLLLVFAITIHISMAKLVLVYSLVVLGLALTCNAATYMVGDNSGWDISTDLDTWAQSKTFVVGDLLC